MFSQGFVPSPPHNSLCAKTSIGVFPSEDKMGKPVNSSFKQLILSL